MKITVIGNDHRMKRGPRIKSGESGLIDEDQGGLRLS